MTEVVGFRIVRQPRGWWWPFKVWDVYAIYHGTDWRGEFGGERFAGGFFTRAGAQAWIDQERKVYGI